MARPKAKHPLRTKGPVGEVVIRKAHYVLDDLPAAMRREALRLARGERDRITVLSSTRFEVDITR